MILGPILAIRVFFVTCMLFPFTSSTPNINVHDCTFRELRIALTGQLEGA
jgi:hypothetical protein